VAARCERKHPGYEENYYTVIMYVFNFSVSSVSIEAYERRIKKLEREKSELSWKLQESTKVLQEQSIDNKSGSRSSDSGNFNEELSTLKRKNNGENCETNRFSKFVPRELPLLAKFFPYNKLYSTLRPFCTEVTKNYLCFSG
jgi:hypothetical protein